LQWHSYEVSDLENNNNVKLISSSDSTKYQIFKYKNHAYGIQFHIEIKGNTISDWGNVKEYRLALESSMGKGALNDLRLEAQKNMNQMNDLASILYKNFINLI
jgi:GMP synthase-like glutamine amidotransferase